MADKPHQNSIHNILLEISTSCNLKCQGCYMRSKAGDELAFSMESFLFVLDATRPQTVTFLGGEPLIWPHLKECIEILHASNIKVYLFSNLIYLDQRMSLFLKKHNVMVTGKMNVGDLSDTKQLKVQCDLIGASAEEAQKMVRGIFLLQEAGYDRSMLSVNNFVRPQNVAYVGQFLAWCSLHNVSPSLEISCADNDLTVSEIDSIVEQVRPFATRPVIPPHFFYKCHHSINTLYIRANGDIQACSGSQTVLANLFSSPDSLQMALEHELLASRRNILDNIKGACQSCELLAECKGGCRAYAERHSPTHSYEKCFRINRNRKGIEHHQSDSPVTSA